MPVEHPCKGLSVQAHAAFLAIADGRLPDFNPRSLVALLDRRLIRRTAYRSIGRVHHAAINIPVYSVVPEVFHQWQTWQAENPDEPV